jgi:starvation-inducible DNA-binding protein
VKKCLPESLHGFASESSRESLRGGLRCILERERDVEKSENRYHFERKVLTEERTRMPVQHSLTHHKVQTPNDLGETAAEAIAEVVNPLVADAVALYFKTKNFHWHMSGKHFRDYHLLLDEQADQIFAMIDILAERVRKLGSTTIRSIGEINRMSRVADNDAVYVEPTDMLRELMEDNKTFAANQRMAHEVCDKYNDIATASLLENFVDETERRVWFLYEHTV